MEITSNVKILRDGGIELSPEAREKLKKLVGKTVKIVIEEKENFTSPLLELCGRADVEIKNGSINHDKYIYSGK